MSLCVPDTAVVSKAGWECSSRTELQTPAKRWSSPYFEVQTKKRVWQSDGKGGTPALKTACVILGATVRDLLRSRDKKRG